MKYPEKIEESQGMWGWLSGGPKFLTWFVGLLDKGIAG